GFSLVVGLRLTLLGTSRNPVSFVAVGISDVPIKDLEDTLPNKFGITLACAPKRVDGFRREAPGIAFANVSPQVDKAKCSWRQERTTRNVETALGIMFKNRGIQCGKFERVRINEGRDEDMEKELLEVFETNKGQESVLIIYIDRAENRSHEYLKLLERRFLIPTQQLTAELAEKIQQ
ncbi:hypothetical protein OESDEN_17358, partial [Oesophagostomum dentatum]